MFSWLGASFLFLFIKNERARNFHPPLEAQDPMPHGMWFKSDQDRQKVWQQVQQIKTTLERRANAAGGSGGGGGNNGGGNNGGKIRNSGNGRGNGNTPQLSQQVQQMNMNDPNLTPNQVELSKTQLQKMLLAMMKSDKFVDMLHTQYITKRIIRTSTVCVFCVCASAFC